MTELTEVNIDLNDLTIAEMEEIEDLLDLPFDVAFGPKAKKAKAFHAVAFIAAKRENPDVTWEEVGDVRLTGIAGVTDADEDSGNSSAAETA